MFLEINEKKEHKKNNKPVFKLELNLNDVEAFGKNAQALIGGYDINILNNIIIHNAFTNVVDFMKSKPSVNNGKINIYSFRRNMSGDLSKFGCVWYKLKSPNAIDDHLRIPKISNPQDGKKLLELAFNEARNITPYSASLVDKKGYKFTFDSQNMLSGASWIASEITIELRQNNNIYIKTPTLITNKHIPTIGGMYYCKVFTPKDAAKILDDIAYGKVILHKSVNNTLRLNYKEDLIKREMEYFIKNALKSDKEIKVQERDGLIMFLPKNKNIEKGLIIYPGGLVEHHAYAPLARAIASKGFGVTIVKMPMELGIFGINLANKVINYEPFRNVKKWAIAGHSLGGVIASLCVQKNAKFDGIVFWGSYPAINLANTNIKGISIVGSNDGKIGDTMKFDNRLPSQSEKVIIEGGNHAYFGYYGEQKGDGKATISREEQQMIVTKKTVDFLKIL